MSHAAGLSPIIAYVKVANSNPDKIPNNFFYEIKKKQPFNSRNKLLLSDYTYRSSIGPNPIDNRFIRNEKNSKLNTLGSRRNLSLDFSLMNLNESLEKTSPTHRILKRSSIFLNQQREKSKMILSNKIELREIFSKEEEKQVLSEYRTWQSKITRLSKGRLGTGILR